MKELRTIDGKQILTVEVCENMSNIWDELIDSDVDITLKRYRNKRSRDQNAYCWELIGQLAAKLGVPKTDVYRECIRHIGGVSEIVCVKDEAVAKLVANWHLLGLGWITDTFPHSLDGYTNVILYYGSSTYDTKQMTNLISIIQHECQQYGIETATPDELAKMEAWSQK